MGYSSGVEQQQFEQPSEPDPFQGSILDLYNASLKSDDVLNYRGMQRVYYQRHGGLLRL
jgi:hypothetical protein